MVGIQSDPSVRSPSWGLALTRLETFLKQASPHQRSPTAALTRFLNFPCDGVSVAWAQAPTDPSGEPHGDRANGTPGKLGKVDLPNWITLSFQTISSTLDHFTQTNFVCVGGSLGAEIRGVTHARNRQHCKKSSRVWRQLQRLPYHSKPKN